MKMKKTIIICLIVIIALIAVGAIVKQKTEQKSREYKIEEISNYKYFVVKENDKYGIIDARGNKKVEAKYDSVIIPNPEKAVFVCYEGEETKVINESGEEVLKQYENIEPLRLKNVVSDLMYEKNTLKYSKDGKYGIVNLEGKKLTNAIYEEIDTLQFKEGELLVKKDEKFGVININGKVLVKAEYDKIESDKYYDEQTGYKKSGYIVSKTTDEGYRYGYVNLDGKELVKTKYNDLSRILNVDGENVYIICAENGKYGLIENGKQVISNDYQALTYNKSNNTVTALKGKKYGVLLTSGMEIIPFEYKQIDVSGSYIYATTTDENVKVFDSMGQETNMMRDIAIIDVENTDYKIHINTIAGKTSYTVYKDEKEISKNEYSYIQYLHNKYFVASNANGKLGIIDDKDNTVLDFNYSSIQEIENTDMVQAINSNTKLTEIYSSDMRKLVAIEDATLELKNDYLKVFNKKEAKYISKDENEITNIQALKDNKIFASQKNGKWGFVNNQGKVVVNYNYEAVTESNKYGFAGIKQNGKWGVADSEGKIIVEPTYELNNDEPTFIGQYYQVVYGNGEVYYTK